MLNSGIESDRFVQLIDEFLCPVCCDVADIPWNCNECGSIYCKLCVQSWSTKSQECPKCRKTITNIRPVGPSLKKIYNNLQIRCKYYEQCQTITCLVDLQSHESRCQVLKCKLYSVCGQNQSQDQELCDFKVCSYECKLLFELQESIEKSDQNSMLQLIKNYKQKIENSLKQNNNVQQIPAQIQQGQQINNGLKWDSKKCGVKIELNNNSCYLIGSHRESYQIQFKFKGYTSGIHYWEVKLDERTENEIKVGVSITDQMDFNTAFCDFSYGYGFYAIGQLRNGSNSLGGQYGKRIRKQGTIGIYLDMTQGILKFSINEQSFGKAFETPELKKGPIYPAVAMIHQAGCTIEEKEIPSWF